MNTIRRISWALVAAAAIPTTLFAAPAPYENAVSKAMHPGKPHIARQYTQPRYYAQPRYYVQPRSYVQPRAVQPQIATVPPRVDQGRRTFSYEPAQTTIVAPRRTYSYEPAPVMVPRYVAPRTSGTGHTYESATMKGMGQFR